jgi:hypothetical protein
VSVVAVSTAGAILAWVGLALGVVILVVVVLLLNRVVRPALEIKRYSEDILDGGLAIAANLDDADQVLRTRELATAVPGLAVAYLQRITGGRPR